MTTQDTATPELAQKDEDTSLIKVADLDRLVRVALAQVETGKVTLGEAIASVLDGKITRETVTPSVPAVIAITEADRMALVEIVDLYGKVAPQTPRSLNVTEQQAIVAERACIDRILALLKTRKDSSIRETLANHLDKVAERGGKADESTERDAKGHYCLKQDEPVEGTSVKIARSVTEPKPILSGAAIQSAYEAGDLTRDEYLAVTSVPDVPRQYDELKTRKALKKDPSLFLKLAKATTQAAKNTTIKVSPNSGS